MDRVSYWARLLNGRLSRRAVLKSGSGFGAGAIALGLVGCGSGDGDAPEETASLLYQPVDTTNNAIKGGIYTADARDVASFDAQNGADATQALHAYSRVVKYKAFRYPDEALPAVEPDAATSWEVSPDGMTYTFKVRPEFKYDPRPPTSGRAMTSEDVRYSYARFAEVNPFRSNLAVEGDPNAPVLGVEAPDKDTFVFTLQYPYAPFLDMLAFNRHLPILPVESESQFDIRNEMRGTAAWRLTEYLPSARLVYEPNPDWYDAAKVNLAGITYFNIQEYSTALAQFRSGDLAYYLVSQEDILPTKNELPDLLLKSVEQFLLAKQWLRFGYKPDSPFLDDRVRRATSMLLDRDLIIETLLNTQAFRDAGLPVEVRWHSAIAPGWPWWLDPKGEEFGPAGRVYFHDPAEAKALMTAAGYSEPLASVFQITNAYDQAYEREAAIMHQMWNESGLFNLTMEVRDYRSDWRGNVHYGSDQHDGIAFGGNQAPPDIDGALQAWFNTSGSDRAGHVGPDGKPDAHLEDLIARQRAETDVVRRTELLQEFQRYNAEKTFMLYGAGDATRFDLAQAWLGNWGVFRTFVIGSEANEVFPHLYIDSSKKSSSES